MRDQLLKIDGVLVWVNPIDAGQTRTVLDAMLRDVALRGPWISAHPDVIRKMGVKKVLYRTKHLGWGTDTYLYRTAALFRDAFPLRLQPGGPRVLKQNRGNGGQGVWKVEQISGSTGEGVRARVLHGLRRSVPEELALRDFMARCEAYFIPDGAIIDLLPTESGEDTFILCEINVSSVFPIPEQAPAVIAQLAMRRLHSAVRQ